MKSQKLIFLKKFRRPARLVLLLAAISVFALPFLHIQAANESEKISVTTNFAEREIAPNEKIEFTLNRALDAGEGRLAVLVGNTDLTALFEFEGQKFRYQPGVLALPAGESRVAIYLVAPGGDWKTLSEFSLKVKIVEPQPDAQNTLASEKVSIGETAPDAETKSSSIEFTPNLSLNVKGQNQTLTFPREAAPERNPFTDLAGQGSFQLKISRRGWNFTNQFDFVGSSFKPEALRFGELGARAPQIDLSSYLVEIGKGRFKVNFGHVSFGSNRHLINSFSSRGLTVTVPLGKQNEISFAAMNGTSIVGFDNFIGITRRKHNVASLTFAREFFKERPNGLRLEISVLRGSVLPLSNFNQSEVNDAEKSLGFGFKAIGSDTRQRLRYEIGFTRSRFTNPADPQLSQGFELTPVRPVTRSARYGEISFDFLEGLKLWREKKLKLTGTFRHERIEPLFRSIGASTQADRDQNQFEVSANFGEINFTYGNLRDRDNLSDIASILKTFNRRRNVILSVALNSFLTPEKPKKWLPQISYIYDETHQFGAFLPANGEFRDLSQVPDQKSVLQSFNALWQFSEKFNLAYRYNRAFQDNRQPGREPADFESAASAVSLGTKPFAALDLTFEISRESQQNFEQPRLDRTFRFGTQTAWRTPFLKNSVLSVSLSTTVAGDDNNFNDSRSADLDAQWLYKFGFGKEKFKKMEAQFFIRYANRYASAVDRQFFISGFNKTQAFNFGLNFNIF